MLPGGRKNSRSTGRLLYHTPRRGVTVRESFLLSARDDVD